MISSVNIIATEVFRQQWDGSNQDKSTSLEKFEQLFEQEVKISLDQWISEAICLTKEPCDHITYQKGGIQLHKTLMIKYG
jgi:hypothetical protein